MTESDAMLWARIAALEAALRQIITSDGIVNYDSSVCWGCGGSRHKRHQTHELDAHEADCMLQRARELLRIPPDEMAGGERAPTTTAPEYPQPTLGPDEEIVRGEDGIWRPTRVPGCYPFTECPKCGADLESYV